MTSRKSAALKAGSKAPFLAGLTRSQISAVLAAATERDFRAGLVVTHQETPADHLFLVARGRARFFTITPEGRKILFFWLPEGEVFGVNALQVRPTEYLLSAETVQDSTLLVWDRPTIRRLANRYPRLLENTIRLANEYLSFYVAAHVALTSDSARKRLVAILFNLARGIGRALPNGIELDVSNEELAQSANVSHFTASRLLSEWQRKGTLVKRRGKILLLSPADLFLNSSSETGR
jgi:CRP-like cAMP-binding protein